MEILTVGSPICLNRKTMALEWQNGAGRVISFRIRTHLFVLLQKRPGGLFSMFW